MPAGQKAASFSYTQIARRRRGSGMAEEEGDNGPTSQKDGSSVLRRQRSARVVTIVTPPRAATSSSTVVGQEETEEGGEVIPSAAENSSEDAQMQAQLQAMLDRHFLFNNAAFASAAADSSNNTSSSSLLSHNTAPRMLSLAGDCADPRDTTNMTSDNDDDAGDANGDCYWLTGGISPLSSSCLSDAAAVVGGGGEARDGEGYALLTSHRSHHEEDSIAHRSCCGNLPPYPHHYKSFLAGVRRVADHRRLLLRSVWEYLQREQQRLGGSPSPRNAAPPAVDRHRRLRSEHSDPEKRAPFSTNFNKNGTRSETLSISNNANAHHTNNPLLSSRGVYRSLLSGRLKAASVMVARKNASSFPLGALPSASFVLIQSAMPILVAEVFIKYLRHAAALRRERTAFVDARCRGRRLSRAFVAWRSVVGSHSRWVSFMSAEFVFRLQWLLQLRRSCRQIVSAFVALINLRREARLALEKQRARKVFGCWRRRAKAAVTATRLLSAAKQHMGPQSLLFRLAMQPTRAVLAVKSVLDMRCAEEDGEKDEAATNTSSLSPSSFSLPQRPTLVAVAPREALLRRVTGRYIPKHHAEVVREAASSSHRTPQRHLIQRIVFGHWRTQLQRRRDVREAAGLREKTVVGTLFAHWRRQAALAMSRREAEARARVEERRVALIRRERALRGELRPFPSRGPSGDDNDGNEEDDEEDALPPPFLIVNVPEKSATSSLTVGPYATVAADTAFTFAQCRRVLSRWTQRYKERVAASHHREASLRRALVVWHRRMLKVTAHARIKRLLFDYWRERLRQYRMRLLADDWRRSHVAQTVLDRWRCAAVADRHLRQRTLACALRRWQESMRVKQSAAALATAKARRALLAWRLHMHAVRRREANGKLAVAVSDRVVCVKVLRRWRWRYLVAKRNAVLHEMLVDIHARRAMALALRRWLLRTADRRRLRVAREASSSPHHQYDYADNGAAVAFYHKNASGIIMAAEGRGSHVAIPFGMNQSREVNAE